MDEGPVHLSPGDATAEDMRRCLDEQRYGSE